MGGNTQQIKEKPIVHKDKITTWHYDNKDGTCESIEGPGLNTYFGERYRNQAGGADQYHEGQCDAEQMTHYKCKKPTAGIGGKMYTVCTTLPTTETYHFNYGGNCYSQHYKGLTRDLKNARESVKSCIQYNKYKTITNCVCTGCCSTQPCYGQPHPTQIPEPQWTNGPCLSTEPQECEKFEAHSEKKIALKYGWSIAEKSKCGKTFELKQNPFIEWRWNLEVQSTICRTPTSKTFTPTTEEIQMWGEEVETAHISYKSHCIQMSGHELKKNGDERGVDGKCPLKSIGQKPVYTSTHGKYDQTTSVLIFIE